jgi:hypothetical protein
MKRGLYKSIIGGLVACVALTTPVLASDAETTASATGNRYGPGTATGTSRYFGDVGFARTDTRSGDVNVARSVAVGADENGMSLSVSWAVAPNRGPALASNLNMTIGRDGQVATSGGLSIAQGGISRTASVGGATGVGPAGPVATSTAGGQTIGGGIVRASATSDTYQPARVVRLAEPRERVVVRERDVRPIVRLEAPRERVVVREQRPEPARRVIFR